MKKKNIALFFAAILTISACDYNDETTITTTYSVGTTSSYIESQTLPSEETEASAVTVEPAEICHGNASNIDGKTVIVSIFSNDTESSWDYESEDDAITIYQTLSYLKTATEWLSEQVSNYNGNAEFIFDWEENDDLLMGANFYYKMIIEESTFYSTQKYFIDNYIDSQALKNKYDADNILYIFFFNSDFSNQVNPWASPSPGIFGEAYETEFINIFVKFDDYHIAPPSAYAHEILHTFGAHDLYYENYAINQEYVDFCTEAGSNDIMFTISEGEEIINEFSDLDAYYVGLKDYSPTVAEWNLLTSEHE